MSVMQQAVEQCRRQRRIVGEGRGPLRERQIRSQDHRSLLVAFGHHLEEQIGLIATEGQIADLVDDEQSWAEDGAVEILLVT